VNLTDVSSILIGVFVGLCYGLEGADQGGVCSRLSASWLSYPWSAIVTHPQYFGGKGVVRRFFSLQAVFAMFIGLPSWGAVKLGFVPAYLTAFAKKAGVAAGEQAASPILVLLIALLLSESAKRQAAEARERRAPAFERRDTTAGAGAEAGALDGRPSHAAANQGESAATRQSAAALRIGKVPISFAWLHLPGRFGARIYRELGLPLRHGCITLLYQEFGPQKLATVGLELARTPERATGCRELKEAINRVLREPGAEADKMVAIAMNSSGALLRLFDGYTAARAECTSIMHRLVAQHVPKEVSEEEALERVREHLLRIHLAESESGEPVDDAEVGSKRRR